MNQLTSIRNRIDRQAELKYNYLANFTNNQFKNNTQPLLIDSYSNRSKLIDRKSLVDSNPHRSHVKSTLHHYSPSTSTFNPQQQSHQEQFSPYNDRQHREEVQTTKNLIQQNNSLKQKLTRSEETIQNLKIELTKKDAQIAKIKQKNKSDLTHFENAVIDKTKQIQTILSKNKTLENELALSNAKLQEQIKKSEEKLELDLKRVQQARRQTHSPKNNIVSRSIDKTIQQVQQSQKENIKDHNDNTQKTTYQSLNSTLALLKPATKLNTQLDKEMRRTHEFVMSIKSMQTKITGHQPSQSLKQLWKWLKGIGHTHSCLKKWKNKVSGPSFLNTSDRHREAIREACSYIQ